MITAVHIIPIDDLREHEVSTSCWCYPLRTEGDVIVHNALDCREKWERQGLRLTPGWENVPVSD